MEDAFIFSGVARFINIILLKGVDCFAPNLVIEYQEDRFYIDGWSSRLAVYNNNLQTVIDADDRLKEFLNSKTNVGFLEQVANPGSSHEFFFIYVRIEQSAVQMPPTYSWIFQCDVWEGSFSCKPNVLLFHPDVLTKLKGERNKKAVKLFLCYFDVIFSDVVALKKYLYYKFFLERI